MLSKKVKEGWKRMSEEKRPKGRVLSFSNWDKEVKIVRHGRRERYDSDIMLFNKSNATSVQVSVSDVTLDSLAVALRDRIEKLGLAESLAVKVVRDKEKKVSEVWLVKTSKK